MRHLAAPIAVLALAACQEASIGTRNSVPTVSIMNYQDGDTVVEAIPFTVRASMGDSDNAIEDLQATWYVGNELVGTCNKLTPDEDGRSECEVVMYRQTDPPRVQVEVRDPRGATASATVDLEVIEQQGYEAPIAEIVQPADGALLLGGEPTLFKGEVSDLQDSPSSLAIEWSSSLDGVMSTDPAQSDGVTQFVQTSLSSGTHVITLKVTDTEGNFTSDLITVDVNGAPSAPVVSISPNPASSSQDLQASIDAPSVDPEGDPITYTYEWLKDGVPQGGLTSSLVLATSTSRGETWTVRVHPDDGFSTGPFGEASVVIENGLPVVTSATISPDPAYTDDVLMVTAVASDPDGDGVNLSYDWFVDGVSTGQTGPSLDGLTWFDKGQLVQVFVTPNDGSADGAQVGSNVVTILNSPPTQPGVSVAPVTPIEGVDDLICSLDTPSTDADGDPVTYSFAWDVDGVPYPRAGDAGPYQTVYIDDSASAADTLTGETWTCSVTALDGVDPSTPGQDSVVIGGLVFVPDYNGTFDIVPDINYACAGGLVNVNITQLTFSDSAGTLSVTGGPVVMTQTPTPIDENFSATGVISGGCTETYTIGGSFQDNDHFIGTFTVSFNGWQCGLTNCTNQSWPVDGWRL